MNSYNISLKITFILVHRSYTSANEINTHILTLTPSLTSTHTFTKKHYFPTPHKNCRQIIITYVPIHITLFRSTALVKSSLIGWCETLSPICHQTPTNHSARFENGTSVTISECQFECLFMYLLNWTIDIFDLILFQNGVLNTQGII